MWGQKGYSKSKTSSKGTVTKVKGERSSDVTSPVILPGKDGVKASVQVSVLSRNLHHEIKMLRKKYDNL